MLLVLLLLLRLCGTRGNRRWEKAISVREGEYVWNIQDSGFITELGLSLKRAWRIVCLDREKEQSCPGYHIEVFFLLWPF